MTETRKHRALLVLMILIAAFGALCLQCVASADSAMTENPPDGWEVFEYPRKNWENSLDLNYWVYTPKDMKPGLPLVVYLHSSSGVKNRALTDPLPALIVNGTIKDVQAVVLVPQILGGYDMDWIMDLDAVVDIIGKVIEEYDVDRERVSLAGFSLGAKRVWNVAHATPERYARMISVCGRVDYLKIGIDTFKDIDVKVFTARNDMSVNAATTINFVSRMQEAGYSASWEELKLSHADTPVEVFGRREIQEWLWLVPETSGEAAEN